jgi:uncharacterized repeat protein (TIGR01451 family)
VTTAARPAAAQSYDLTWWTLDGGGLTDASGAPFDAGMTAGQPDAGGPFAGGSYSVSGGFWALFAGGASLVADLWISKSDGQASSVPGTSVSYTIVVTNDGPDAAASASVLDAPPPALTGVSWTCTPSPGAACPASGNGPINHTVSLPAGGSATYSLSGSLDPAATGTLTNTASVVAPAGVSDPDPGDNAASDTDVLTPLADLGLVMADSPDPVGSEAPLRYTLQVTNAGPSTSGALTVTDSLPGSVGFVASTPACSETAGQVTCALAGLPPSGSTALSLDVVVHAGAQGSAVNSASVTASATDPNTANNAGSETTEVFLRPEGELVHGARQAADLAAVGGARDLDYYRIRQQPHASYEVLLEGATGDLGAAGPALERVAADGVTVLQAAQPAGAGKSRSLRWINSAAVPVDDEYVRVGSLGCGADCSAEDGYRLRVWDTTLSLARFNNSVTQATFVLLQNTDAAPVTGAMLFWSTAGVLLHEEPFSLAPHAESVFNSSFNPPLIGQSGSLTLVHDGRHGAVSGKAVSLEPASGFTFDIPLVPRPR